MQKISSTRAAVPEALGLAQRLFQRLDCPCPRSCTTSVCRPSNRSEPTMDGRFPGRITLIRATDAVYIPGAEPDCGWGALAAKGIDVEWAPGKHETMFMEPNLRSSATSYASSLAKGEAASS